MHKTLNNKHENLVIITAPSGAGKTTLIKNILDHANSKDHRVFLSISHTTRQPREGEEHGKDYYFMDEKEFNHNISANEYIEHAVVHGNLYGTPRSQIDNYLAEDYKVLLEIDWQGAVNVLDQYPNATSIFISPPSIEELRIRLENRGLDSQEVIEKRVQGAKLEMEKATQFRHQITNISLDIATKNLLNIIFRENHG
ncbi:MAG: guanylate kinase [SAR86 cluster bacterium]|jgi:guanylate kinase|nr:guanylate kinase [SAR86 cluster bacterium]MBL6810856.1 guanylate kinase [SAR86 cluster bacterium]